MNGLFGMRILSLAIVATALFATKSNAKDIYFCWSGANGYSMTGSMELADGSESTNLITEQDLSAFEIVGYSNGKFLGSWSMAEIYEDTTWHLRYDRALQSFLVGDGFAGLRSQGWNANGNVENCGSPGFGFNSGNFAQDICVDGKFIDDSSVHPETPFTVSVVPLNFDCSISFPLS